MEMKGDLPKTSSQGPDGETRRLRYVLQRCGMSPVMPNACGDRCSSSPNTMGEEHTPQNLDRAQGTAGGENPKQIKGKKGPEMNKEIHIEWNFL